jgi:hypothetical protein
MPAARWPADHGSGFGFGAALTVRCRARGIGTQATAGIVYNILGPHRTFTYRVQSGFGQAVQHHG